MFCPKDFFFYHVKIKVSAPDTRATSQQRMVPSNHMYKTATVLTILCKILVSALCCLFLILFGLVRNDHLRQIRRN